MSEAEPLHIAAIEEAALKALATLVVDVANVDPIEQLCARNAYGQFLHVAAYEVKQGHIDAAIEAEPRNLPVERYLRTYRERLLGHWVLSGADDTPGNAYQGDAEMAAFAFSLAEEYFAGGAT